MKKIGIIVMLLSLCMACKKKITIVDKNFVGTWSGSQQATATNSLWKSIDYEIVIMNNSKGTYSKEGIFTRDKSGTVKIKDEELWIGTKSFTIQKHPKFVSDTCGNYYEMTVNNITYQKLD